MPFTLRFIFVLSVLLIGSKAQGQSIVGADTAEAMAHDATQYFLISEILEDEATGQSSGKSARKPPVGGMSTVANVGATSGFAVRLAARYPQEQRGEATRIFESLLTDYHKIEKMFGIQRGDVAGAVAAFIAGSYMGYNNSDFPDVNFPPLVGQMRAILAADPRFRQMSSAEKLEMYEQMATLGMFVATSQIAQKERPDARAATNMRAAGKYYLETLLKIDADRIRISSEGLTIAAD